MKSTSAHNVITVYLALGSNLGDRIANLRAATTYLQAHMAIEHISAIYETEPAYLLDQPNFLNLTLRARTDLAPDDLLNLLKQIEQAVGRVPGRRFGPRMLDLDILLYDDQVIKTDNLVVPHPRMAERPFVLVPLAEIAPDLVPPGWAHNIATAAAQVHGNGDIIVKLEATIALN